MLGNRLREARRNKGKSQEELAKRSGVSQSEISAIEKGERPNPGWLTVARLERALRLRSGSLTRGLLSQIERAA